MERANLKNLLFVILVVTVYRFFVLYFSNIDLYQDEAYYWGWSRSFEFGYYSKPPMIAWVISLFTSLCNDSVICIKLPSLIIYPITTIIIFLISKELFDQKVAFWSGVAFITLPAVSLSSLIISTDVVLLLFWSLTLLFFIKALKTNKDIYWIFAGFSAGLGLLSKYTMILFLPSIFIYLFISKKDRKFLKNPKLYMSMLLAALVYLPNLIWNYRNHFVSFMHTKEISNIDRDLFHVDKMLEFLGAQFAVFGLIFFSILLFLIFKPFVKDDRFRLLYSFTLFFLAVITLQSFISRAFANWAAPTYIGGTILVVSYLIYQNREKILKIAIAINILLAIIFYHYHAILDLLNIEITSKIDPYKRVLGWSSLAKEVSKILKEYPKAKLLTDNREIMAQLIYYIKPHPFDAGFWNPEKKLRNHYDLTIDLNKYKGMDFIYVTKRESIEDVLQKFKSAKKIKVIKIELYKDYKRVFYVYYLHKFKGY